MKGLCCTWMLPLLALAPLSPARAQDKEKPPPVLDRAALIAAAREDMTVWFATNTRSLKVQQIRKDPRVTLYYADHAKATGYVALAGKAELIEDRTEILKRKRAYWDQAFPGLKNLVLIKVVPERLDVLDYKAGTQAHPETWRPPSVEFGPLPKKD